MTYSPLYYWIALNGIPSISFKQFDQLHSYFGGDLQKIFEANPTELQTIPHMTGALLKKLISWKQSSHTWIDDELKLMEEKNILVLTYQDKDYPVLLKTIYDPPPMLYIQGQLPKTKLKIGVVGTRKASAYGMSVTDSLCQGLAKQDITIVSGLAQGIDTQAHRSTLDATGSTIAVLGNGLWVTYPRENKRLYAEIAEKGALISEFPLMKGPEVYHFPKRNRVISGLSHGIVVIEAPLKSGALITARMALEQGREVFAVPGNISVPNSQGTHGLIQQGAKLVTCVSDILCEFDAAQEFGATIHSLTSQTEIGQSLSREEKNILDFLVKPMSFDDLQTLSGLSTNDLSHFLLTFEMNRQVKSYQNQYFRIGA